MVATLAAPAVRQHIRLNETNKTSTTSEKLDASSVFIPFRDFTWIPYWDDTSWDEKRHGMTNFMSNNHLKISILFGSFVFHAFQAKEVSQRQGGETVSVLHVVFHMGANITKC